MNQVISPVFKGFSRLLASCRIAGLALLLAGAAKAQETSTLIVSPPKAIAPVMGTDENGDPRWVQPKGAKLTALHFWATWCVPCIAELSEVDEAQGKYEQGGLRIAALALDGKNMANVKKFFADHKIEHLVPLLDDDMQAFQSVQSPGLPVTIFLNSKGEEIARGEGPLDWNSPEVTGFIEKHLK